MRLSYCGLPFDDEPPALDKIETQLNQQFLKRLPNFAYPRHIPTVQPTQDLQKRGISYHTQTSQRIQSQIPVTGGRTSDPDCPTNLSSVWCQKQQMLREVAERHKKNIQQRLQHRLNVARQMGNRSLVAQLEQEMHQMA